MIGDWIPYGSNQTVALNEKLGSSERIQGGMFTGVIDSNPETMAIEVDAGLASVDIMNYDVTGFMTFNAEIHFAEELGIVQVEHFGVHVSEDGCVLYGLAVEAINDRRSDMVSLDHLCRLVADVITDSSRLMDGLLFRKQKMLMDVAYNRLSENRLKFQIVCARAIVPKLRAKDYLDGGDFENEFRQVVGDVHSAHDITSEDILVIGQNGMFLIGPRCEDYDDELLEFLSLMSRSVFLDDFFLQTFLLADDLKRLRMMIVRYKEDPSSIDRIRRELSRAGQYAILAKEILMYLKESLLLSAENKAKHGRTGRDSPLNAIVRGALKLDECTTVLMSRICDLAKNVDGATYTLQSLREMMDVAAEAQAFRFAECMSQNTKCLEDVLKSGERASQSGEIMNCVLSGTLAFGILDRLTGGWSVADTEWASYYIHDPFIKAYPGVWFLINMLLWAGVAYALRSVGDWLAERSGGNLLFRFKAIRPIDMAAFLLYLSCKPAGEEEVMAELDDEGNLAQAQKRFCWVEDDLPKWCGSPPKVAIAADFANGFLLTVELEVEKRGGMLRDRDLYDIFFGELDSYKVFADTSHVAAQFGI